MALGKNIVITADTQQAISEINKLDVSQSNLIENSVKMAQSLTGVGAALGGITALAGGVIAMASSFHNAAVASSELWDQMNTTGGGNLKKLTDETGGLIASQALLTAQARLTGQGLGDFTAVLGKAATVMADKFGQSEEDVLGKLVKMVVTGKKVERGMAQLGIEFKSTGDKVQDQKLILELLTKQYGDLAVQAQNAGEMAKAYATTQAQLAAAALNTGGISAWTSLTMGITKAKDALVLYLASGFTAEQARQNLINQQMLKTIEDETAALTKQVDTIRELNALLKSKDDADQVRASELATKAETNPNVAALEYSKAIAEVYGEIQKLENASYSAGGVTEVLFGKAGGLVNEQTLKVAALNKKIEEMERRWRAAHNTDAEGLAKANKLRKERDDLLQNMRTLEDAEKNYQKTEMAKIDTVRKGLEEQAKRAWDLVRAKEALGAADAKSARDAALTATGALEIYKKQGKAASDYYTILETERKKLSDATQKELEEQLEAAKKYESEAAKAYKSPWQWALEDVERYKAASDDAYPDWAASGRLKFAVEDIDKEMKKLQYTISYGSASEKLEAAESLIAKQKDRDAIKEQTAWQSKLNEANSRKNSLLVYQGEAGDMAISTKSLELQLQQAEIDNNQKLATQLSAQINDIKAKNNEYGKLQTKLGEYGMAWTSLKTVTEGAFRGAGEAIMMSNAELAKAGKTRAQVIASQLKSTLKALALENIVKGGTKLAEAIGASVLTPALAPGLYASAAKHFAVAAFAGMASSSISAGGGPKTASNTNDKNQAANTATQTSSNVNYVYNISNSMMLSNPDALVRNLNSMQRSYQQRRD